jgi:uncharacterized membrane protein
MQDAAMTFPPDFLGLGLTDALALSFLLLGWLGLGYLIENPPKAQPSVSHLMMRYRREWMVEFVTRDPRIFDASIIDSLRQGTSFFASACMIAIGGGVALMGKTGQFEGLASDLASFNGPTQVLQAKILVIILFLTNAVLKFVWSHRLFGYCAILMAAVPNNPDDPSAQTRAAQAAEINIFAARSFNRGLRSVYFALGALGWLFGPEALLVTTSTTLFVTWRREFASNSRQVLFAGHKDTG